MVILTGVSGFIGSSLLTCLNENGYFRDVVVVDDFYKIYKDKNIGDKAVREFIHRDIFLDWFEKTSQHVDFVFHIGARTDTSLTDIEIFNDLNLDYSKRIFTVCANRNIPIIYASSAATYGDGSRGFEDNEEFIKDLNPLNPYAKSKQDFDLWVLAQTQKPEFWAGFKFFNVYGANEYHKGRMASVIFHTFNQIKAHGSMNLFKSHKEGVLDGHQSRDFIYVKDVLKVLLHFMKNGNSKSSGIYNLGTGKARTFLDLASQTFKSMGIKEQISFVDTPIDIRESYQYFTQANINKLKTKGSYGEDFYELEAGIDDYVSNYLKKNKYY